MVFRSIKQLFNLKKDVIRTFETRYPFPDYLCRIPGHCNRLPIYIVRLLIVADLVTQFRKSKNWFLPSLRQCVCPRETTQI